jgi:hypothetical protein
LHIFVKKYFEPNAKIPKVILCLNFCTVCLYCNLKVMISSVLKILSLGRNIMILSYALFTYLLKIKLFDETQYCIFVNNSHTGKYGIEKNLSKRERSIVTESISKYLWYILLFLLMPSHEIDGTLRCDDIKIHVEIQSIYNVHRARLFVLWTAPFWF